MDKLKFMEIKNKTETKAELYIYGDIVNSEWGRWEEEDHTPNSIKSILDEVKDVKNLDIFINSGGGSVFAGMAIYNILKRNTAFKTVYVDGLAASISSVIALAGDKVIIPKNAYFMIHKASAFAWGDSNEFDRMSNLLKTIEKGILNVYEDNLKEGVNIDEIKQFLEDETWFTGDEASRYFNIEVGEEIQAVACATELQFKNIPENLNKKLKNNITINVNNNSNQDYNLDEISSKIIEQLKVQGVVDIKPEPIKIANFNELRKKLINI